MIMMMTRKVTEIKRKKTLYDGDDGRLTTMTFMMMMMMKSEEATEIFMMKGQWGRLS